MREGILGNFQAGIKGTLVIVYKPYGWDESKPYLYFNASTHQWVTIYPPVEDTDEQLLEFTMLWIECSDGTLDKHESCQQNLYRVLDGGHKRQPVRRLDNAGYRRQ